jgi:signal transduction histidine kinase
VGLTIVRRLSERFSWPIQVSSEPGVGTTIEISFPGSCAEAV